MFSLNELLKPVLPILSQMPAYDLMKDKSVLQKGVSRKRFWWVSQLPFLDCFYGRESRSWGGARRRSSRRDYVMPTEANRLKASWLAACFRKLLWVEILALFTTSKSSNLDIGCTWMPQQRVQGGNTDLIKFSGIRWRDVSWVVGANQ